MFKSLFLLVTLSVSVFASEGKYLSVQGAHFTSSPSYFTNSIAELEIVYQDHRAPWGTRVSLIYGWEGEVAFLNKFEWKNRSEKPLSSTAPYTWKTNLTQITHERSSNERLTALNFVLKVEYPGRSPFYIKGNSSSPMGYLRAQLPPMLNYKNFMPLQTVVVEKN